MDHQQVELMMKMREDREKTILRKDNIEESKYDD
jgi:hypothetical protein